MSAKPKLCVCCPEYDGECEVVFSTRPEDWDPEKATSGEASLLFHGHWTKKGCCPAGWLHLGLPSDDMRGVLPAVREQRCHVWCFDAVTLGASDGH
jgi:hypothetical protein